MLDTQEIVVPSEVIAGIAKEVLGLETLEERKSDQLDFSEQAVWTLRRALEAAYRAGAEHAAGSRRVGRV